MRHNREVCHWKACWMRVSIVAATGNIRGGILTFKAEQTSVIVTLLMSTLYGFMTRKRAAKTCKE